MRETFESLRITERTDSNIHGSSALQLKHIETTISNQIDKRVRNTTLTWKRKTNLICFRIADEENLEIILQNDTSIFSFVISRLDNLHFFFPCSQSHLYLLQTLQIQSNVADIVGLCVGKLTCLDDRNDLRGLYTTEWNHKMRTIKKSGLMAEYTPR